MANYHPDRAADLVLQSDSDESLLVDESCYDEYSQSDSIGGNSSDESSDPDVPTTSLAVRRSRGGGAIQPRARRNYVWAPATRQPQLQSFTGNPGPTSLASITDIENCLEYFQLIVTDDILDMVVNETNCYPNQFFLSIANALPRQSRANKWKRLTLSELKIFLDLTLLTELIDKRGHLSEYRSKKPLYLIPFYGQTMPRNRYQIMMKFLHFNDNEARPSDSTDKLYKLRSIHDKIVAN